MEGYSPDKGCSADHSPKYKGVRKRKWGKWVSEIRLPHSRDRVWLGSFDSPEKAARVFDAALFCLRGPEASFNFPENPPEIPGGRSMSPQEIQVVANRFANEEPLLLPPEQPQGGNSALEGINSSRGDNSAEFDHDVSGDGGATADNVDNNTTIDWSFLDMLEPNMGSSEFGIFPGIDSDMSRENDLSYHNAHQPPPSGFNDDGGGNFEEEDFLQHSSLWNF